MSAKWIIADSDMTLWCEDSSEPTVYLDLHYGGTGIRFSRDQACDLVMALQYWIDHGGLPPNPTEEAA